MLDISIFTFFQDCALCTIQYSFHKLPQRIALTSNLCFHELSMRCDQQEIVQYIIPISSHWWKRYFCLYSTSLQKSNLIYQKPKQHNYHYHIPKSTHQETSDRDRENRVSSWHILLDQDPPPLLKPIGLRKGFTCVFYRI